MLYGRFKHDITKHNLSKIGYFQSNTTPLNLSCPSIMRTAIRTLGNMRRSVSCLFLLIYDLGARYFKTCQYFSIAISLIPFLLLGPQHQQSVMLQYKFYGHETHRRLNQAFVSFSLTILRGWDHSRHKMTKVSFRKKPLSPFQFVKLNIMGSEV
jgi:hypothetical protein